MAHVWYPDYLQSAPDLARCRASVHDGGRSVRFHQCSRKVLVRRKLQDGNEYGFCRQHDPEAIEAKRESQRQQWRLATEVRDRRAAERAERQAAVDACVEALRQVAAGHDDARALALAAIARLDAAQGTEAQRAETSSGSVHEGAGPKDDAPTPAQQVDHD